MVITAAMAIKTPFSKVGSKFCYAAGEALGVWLAMIIVGAGVGEAVVSASLGVG
jgi:hypothetical protein